MADNDQNESDNKSIPNQLGPITTRLEEIGQQAYSIPARERELRRRARASRSAIESIEEIESVIGPAEVYNQIRKKNVNSLRRLEPQIMIGVQSRLERSNLQLVNAIGREYSESSISGRINSMSRDPDIALSASAMMNMPYEQLAQQRAEIQSSINELRSHSMTTAARVFTRRGISSQAHETLSQNEIQMQELMQRLAPINAAMRSQRSLGLDPESKMQTLFSTVRHAEGILGKAELTESIKGGAYNLSDLKQQEIQLADKLVKAFKELNEAVGKSPQEIKKLRQEAEETADALNKTQEIARQAQQSGGGSNILSKIAPITQFASQMMSTVGNVTRQLGVAQPLARVQNISGLAGIENQKYDLWKAAISGDIQAQMMLPELARAQGFGSALATAQSAAVAADAASGLGQTVSGAAQSIIGARLGPMGASATMQGINDMAQGIGNAAIAGSDVINNISSTQARVQGTQAHMEMMRQLSAIPAEQLQIFRDYSTGLGGIAANMGKRGGQWMAGMLDIPSSDIVGPQIATLQRLANMRVSPQQFQEIATSATGAIGELFDVQQVETAQGLARSGVGTLSQNMSRMMTLGAAGSNNPQEGFRSVLEAAFSKSLKDAPTLNKMVENTAALAQASAARLAGTDITGQVAAQISKLVDPNDPNKIMAVQRAATITDYMRQQGTRTDFSLPVATAMSQLSKLGLGTFEIVSALQMEPELLARAADPNTSSEEATKIFTERGISLTGGRSAQQMAQEMLTAKRMQIAGGTVWMAGVSPAVQQLVFSGKTSEEELLEGGATSEEITQLRRAFSTTQFQTGTQAFRALGAVGARAASATPEIENALAGQGGSTLQQKSFDMATAGAKQQAIAADAATRQFQQSAFEVFNALNTQQKTLEKLLDSGIEVKMSTAAAEAAGNMKNSSDVFSEAVSKFDGIAARMEALLKTIDKSAPAGVGIGANNLNSVVEQRKMGMIGLRKDSAF